MSRRDKSLIRGLAGNNKPVGFDTTKAGLSSSVKLKKSFIERERELFAREGLTQDVINRELADILPQLSTQQIMFIISYIYTRNKKEACNELKIGIEKVDSWGEIINYAARLLSYDKLASGKNIESHYLLRALQVKLQGLDSKNEVIRQKAATELREWVLGKASAKREIEFSGRLQIEDLNETIEKVYSEDDIVDAEFEDENDGKPE